MISKKTCDELNEIQAEILAEMEFFEDLLHEIQKITDKPQNFKKKDLSEYLQNLLKSRKEESEG